MYAVQGRLIFSFVFDPLPMIRLHSIQILYTLSVRPLGTVALVMAPNHVVRVALEADGSAVQGRRIFSFGNRLCSVSP